MHVAVPQAWDHVASAAFHDRGSGRAKRSGADFHDAACAHLDVLTGGDRATCQVNHMNVADEVLFGQHRTSAVQEQEGAEGRQAWRAHGCTFVVGWTASVPCRRHANLTWVRRWPDILAHGNAEDRTNGGSGCHR